MSNEKRKDAEYLEASFADWYERHWKIQRSCVRGASIEQIQTAIYVLSVMRACILDEAESSECDTDCDTESETVCDSDVLFALYDDVARVHQMAYQYMKTSETAAQIQDVSRWN